MYVEQQISGVHGKMVVYHENLKRLRKRLEIVRQVCAAPELYAKAVIEVYRRKMFGDKFREVSNILVLFCFSYFAPVCIEIQIRLILNPKDSSVAGLTFEITKCDFGY